MTTESFTLALALTLYLRLGPTTGNSIHCGAKLVETKTCDVFFAKQKMMRTRDACTCML